MKRPPIFCLVATWCGLGMLIQTAHLAPPPPWDFLPLVAVCFLIWQTVGLVQLKPFNRWFAVVFCAWWAIALVWNAAVRLPLKLFPAITFFSVFIALNVLSAWYLARRSFREFAVRFVRERQLGRARHSPMMQKVSEKKILSDIHDMKADCENNPCQGEEP